MTRRRAAAAWKAKFGFALLIVIALLAAIIGLGKVEESTRFGLQIIILGCLTTIAGGFTVWAFRDDRNGDDEEEDK